MVERVILHSKDTSRGVTEEGSEVKERHCAPWGSTVKFCWLEAGRKGEIKKTQREDFIKIIDEMF